MLDYRKLPLKSLALPNLFLLKSFCTSGQHEDARMNIVLAMTAIRMGGSLANHVEVKELLKTTDNDGKEQVCGAKVRDLMTGEVF